MLKSTPTTPLTPRNKSPGTPKRVHFHNEIDIEGRKVRLESNGTPRKHDAPSNNTSTSTTPNNKPRNTPFKHILLLTLLYTLQGVPLGLTFGSIPYLVQQSLLAHTSSTSPPEYSKTLGIFSFAAYPFSIKILWAPLIDGFFSRSIGRRKSWILPVQFIAALMMLYIGYHIEHWIETMQVGRMTLCFTTMVLFCSMQDVAVDGWGLKLARDSAALCQSVGISTGYFLSYTIFLVLSSPELRNWALDVEEDVAFLTLRSYLWFWAVMYLAVTGFIGVFVVEQRDEEEELLSHSQDGDQTQTQTRTPWQIVRQVYKYTFDILFRIRNIHWFVALWISARLATTVADTLTPIKMVEKGIRKDSIALVASVLAPMEYVWVWIGSRLQKRYGSLRMWSLMYFVRVCVGFLGSLLVLALSVGWNGSEGASAGVNPTTNPNPPPMTISPGFSWQFLSFAIISLLYSSSTSIMFVSQSFFFNQIAEDKMGGTYSTLLNTFANLAGTLPKYVVFAMSDALAKSEWHYDSYYVLSASALVYGILWLYLMRSRLLGLERAPISSWRIPGGVHEKRM